MSDRWMTGPPPTEQLYVVRIDSGQYHFTYSAIRKWKDGHWSLMAPQERVVKWLHLEGIDL